MVTKAGVTPAGSGAVLVVDRDAGAPPLETRLLGYVNGLSAFACAGGNGAATCAMPNVPSVLFAGAADGGADGGAGLDPLAPPIPCFHFEEPLENDWGAGGAASAPEHEIDEEHAPLVDARTAFAAGEDRRRGPPPDEDGGDGPGDDGPPPPPPPPYAILGEGAVAARVGATAADAQECWIHGLDAPPYGTSAVEAEATVGLVLRVERARACRGTAAGEDCPVECAAGKAGGKVTCARDGAWSVTPCLAPCDARLLKHVGADGNPATHGSVWDEARV